MSASVPILVVDVNGDGLNDLIVGQAHGYGLDWYEQVRDGAGTITWMSTPSIPTTRSTTTCSGWTLTATARANWSPASATAPTAATTRASTTTSGIYYFKWNGESFAKQVIDYGPIRQGTGCGITFAVADLRGTGRLDVVAPGKDGLYVFYNEGAPGEW